MPRLATVLIWALVLPAAIGGTWLTAAGAAELGPREQVSFTARLRAKEPATRITAIHELAQFPGPDAAQLLIRFGLSDADAEARRTAYATLLTFKDQREVCGFLIDQLNQEARRLRHDSSAPLLLAVLLSSSLADIQKSTDRYFEKLAASRDGPVFAAAMADLLAAHRLREDIEPLMDLAKSKMAEKLVVRRAIVHALAQIDEPDAIDALVNVAALFDGEVLADIYEYLALVTKKQITDPAEWAKWWAENKAAFQFPPGLVRPEVRKIENLVVGTTTQYYGLPLYARRMVFVVDMSRSMLAPAGIPSQSGMGLSRIDAARRELHTVLTALDTNVSFGIVIFDRDAKLWKRQLVEATSANKLDAIRFVEKAQLELGTSTYDALLAAFKFDAEAIYLLTDGAPASGTVVNPVAIVNTITAQNRSRRLSLYTIGIGVGPPGSPFEGFLKSLAEQNYALFRRVDE